MQGSARSACKIIYFNRLKLADGKERIPWIPGIEPEVLLEQGNIGDSVAGDRRIQRVDSGTKMDEEADNTKKQEVMVTEKGPQGQHERLA